MTNHYFLKKFAVVLDPLTTLFSVFFVSLFVMTFGLEQYGSFIIYTALFSLALNNNWGFDGAARSFLSQSCGGDKKLESLYIVCVYVAISASVLFIALNLAINYFDYYETLFILSAFAQLTTAVAGTIYLKQDNIIAERLLFSTFNNINFFSLLLCLSTSSDINIFFTLRFILIFIIVIVIHFLFSKKIIQKNIILNANNNFRMMTKTVLKYSINNLSASVIWQLNPLILSMMVTPTFIGAFGLYFRIAGLIISCQGYLFSWSVIQLKNNVLASSSQKIQIITKIYSVILPVAITSFILYVTTTGYIIEYWIGQSVILPQIEILALGLWMGLMIVMSPLNNMVNIFDRVDTVWIITGVLSAILHCSLIVFFTLMLELPLIAFPVSLLLLPLPVTLYYVYRIIYYPI
jgi:hypothetical protein